MLLVAFLLTGLRDIVSIKVHGATVFSPDQIIRVSNLKIGKAYKPPLVRGAEMRIQSLYETRGYFHVSVVDSTVQTDKGIEVHLVIDEGPRAKLVDIVAEGAQRVDSLSLLRILMRSAPHDLPVFYDESIVANMEKSLYSLYQNSGFPYVEVNSSLEEVAPDLIRVRIRVREGPRVRIRDVIIRGNKKVKTDIISREIEIKAGDQYNFKKISRSIQRIYSTGLFSLVQYNLDSPGVDSLAILYFTVKETKARYVDVGGGFHTPWELQSKVSVGHLNLWGRGQRGEIGGEASWNFVEFPRRKLHLSYSEPYFLGFRLDATARLAYSYDVDLDYEDFTANFYLRKSIGEFLSFSPGSRWSTSRRLTVDTLSKFESNIIVNALSQELLLDSRDNIFDPTKGMYGRYFLEEAGWVMGGDEDHIKQFFSLSTYSRLTKGGYFLAARVSLGYIMPYGRTVEIDPTERFTLGGDGTVRGYTRYSIGQYDPRSDREEGGLQIRSGSKLYNINIELRKHLSKTWGFALFTDAGGLWKNYRPIDLSESGWSAGLGVRYYLPVGPIRLDWARPVLGSGWGIVHIGLGHMF